MEGADLVGEEPQGLLRLAHAGDVLDDRHRAQDRAVVFDGRRREHDRPPRAIEAVDVDDHVRERAAGLQRLRRRPVFRVEPLAGLGPVRRVGLELVDRAHRRLAHPDRAQDVVAQEHLAVGRHDAEADRGGFDDGSESGCLPRQGLLGVLLLADVPERSHHAVDVAARGAYDVGVGVDPDPVSVLVPVVHLASERALSQQGLQRRVPGRAGEGALRRSLLGRPIASSRVQPNSSSARSFQYVTLNSSSRAGSRRARCRASGPARDRRFGRLARGDVGEHGEIARVPPSSSCSGALVTRNQICEPSLVAKGKSLRRALEAATSLSPGASSARSARRSNTLLPISSSWSKPSSSTSLSFT